MFVVRVPVLSLQITVVQPKVSTEGKDLTIAFIRAILFVPRAKHLIRNGNITSKQIIPRKYQLSYTIYAMLMKNQKELILAFFLSVTVTKY